MSLEEDHGTQTTALTKIASGMVFFTVFLTYAGNYCDNEEMEVRYCIVEREIIKANLEHYYSTEAALETMK